MLNESGMVQTVSLQSKKFLFLVIDLLLRLHAEYDDGSSHSILCTFLQERSTLRFASIIRQTYISLKAEPSIRHQSHSHNHYERAVS
jgi:hypothetical protein